MYDIERVFQFRGYIYHTSQENFADKSAETPLRGATTFATIYKASWHEYFYTSGLNGTIEQYLETFGFVTMEGMPLTPHGQERVMPLNNIQDSPQDKELFSPKCY